MFSHHKKQVKAVFFDLDDTLFDHKNSRLKGLAAIQARLPKLAAVQIGELERDHDRLLDANYDQVLDHKLSVSDGILERISTLCAMHGEKLSLIESQSIADLYEQVYIKNRQPVPGSKDLLNSLSKHVRLGVVSNGLLQTQIDKLRACGIADLLDFIVISDVVGFRKPEREIFELALEKADVTSSEAVYVGDSWNMDVLPAVKVGLKAVWLNRYGLGYPSPPVAKEITSYVNVDTKLFLDW